MARAPKAPKDAASEQSGADFVLERNFGWVEAGAHRFIEAGRELFLDADGDLISLLHKLGAPLRAL